MKKKREREKIENYRKYTETYYTEETRNAVWILKETVSGKELGNIEANLYQFTPSEGKEIALRNIPKSSYSRRLVVKVNLTDGRKLKDGFPITVTKFKADKNHIEFIPTINDNMRQYIYPIQMGNIPPKNIKSVELYFEGRAK